MSRRYTFYEFFAGGGMARLGLGESWACLFANEWCPRKAASYVSFFGSNPEPKVEDVAKLAPGDIPGGADLAWASFPCQDLSLAGQGAGLSGARSGTFRPFWNLIRRLHGEGRPPKLVVLENVVGTLSSHGGRDFSYIMECMTEQGYAAGAVVADAADFLPQSRPRLFIIGALDSLAVPQYLTRSGSHERWHPPVLRKATQGLSSKAASGWIWWDLPDPPPRKHDLAQLLEEQPPEFLWHTPEETSRLVSLMDPHHAEKLRKAQRLKRRVVGTIYRRTRLDSESGIKCQRAEVRFDGVAGCLRTPAGGSSRQIVLIVEGHSVRSRLLSAREAARLMGVPDEYPLPESYNEGYHLFGDGVAVPVVSWIARHLLEPVLDAQKKVAAA
jgi:DNA (cytosine-5)-methyltransferase 1